jgi:hypothetical protein
VSVLAVRKVMDIERLVTWALRDQGLGWVGKERPPREDASDYGTLIDDDRYGSHPTIGLLSDDDATLVKSAIDELPFDARVLVIQYGRSGLRPVWGKEGIGRPQQLRNKRGQPMWRYRDPNNRRGPRSPKYDMLAFSARKERIELERAEYGVWWQALVDLVVPLNNVMETHWAEGPEAPARPWLAIDDSVAVPLDDGEEDEVEGEDDLGVREVTLADVRRAAVGEVVVAPRDWGAPGTGEKPVRGPLTVVYAEPKRQKPVHKKPAA